MKSNTKKFYSRLLVAAKTLAFAFVIMLAFAACEKEDGNQKPLEEGSVAPTFTLQSTEGTEVSLSDFDNKVVVLFFFGNGCPSCKSAASSVESMLVTPFALSTDYMVLGLDQWDGNSASVQAFKAATSVSFPLLLEASGVAADYKTTYDRLVVIDKTGKIVFSGTQGAAGDIAAVKAKVEELL